jgi:DNA-binding transcriptional MerR regulator
LTEKREKLFRTSQFAHRAGVTIRAVRYYDKEGLLKPSGHTEVGHRLYSEQDYASLQKILTLKLIGLTLEEIKNIIKDDSSPTAICQRVQGETMYL